mmetsp:Transcript_19382/g.49310  ORF Transcript_19382/g.49310 Transcript_19382/m.49310 type:complete len:225 (+) Transcript_19382:878-1552(+)
MQPRSGGFSDEYRMMGDWRLTFQPAFAKGLGYQFVLQFDSDSYVMEPSKINLVHFMRSKTIWFANNHAFFYEVKGYMQGLPELTAFWIRTRRFNVKGPLYTKTRPANISGLHTIENAITALEPFWTGWPGRMLSGFFVVIDMHWWFDRWVSDFVELVVKTGAHIEHRWNELSVQSIIWDVFVPEAHSYSFSPVEEIHGGHSRLVEQLYMHCFGYLNTTNTTYGM